MQVKVPTDGVHYDVLVLKHLVPVLVRSIGVYVVTSCDKFCRR